MLLSIIFDTSGVYGSYTMTTLRSNSRQKKKLLYSEAQSEKNMQQLYSEAQSEKNMQFGTDVIIYMARE